jgi:hypothetical protein
MCPVLMLGAVTGITEGLATANELALVRLFTCVTAQVSLQVFQARVSLCALLKLHNTIVQLQLMP